jgi:hypothetical protein
LLRRIATRHRIAGVILLGALTIGFVAFFQTWFYEARSCTAAEIACSPSSPRGGADTAGRLVDLFILLNVALFFLLRFGAGVTYEPIRGNRPVADFPAAATVKG